MTVSSLGRTRKDQRRKVAARQLGGSGGGLAGLYFFEEPGYADAEETEERKPGEDVDEGPVGGLALEFHVETRLCRFGVVGFAGLTCESAGHAGCSGLG